MKAEDLYRKEFGDADSIPKESVIRLLRLFAKVLEMEREQVKNSTIPDVDGSFLYELKSIAYGKGSSSERLEEIKEKLSSK